MKLTKLFRVAVLVVGVAAIASCDNPATSATSALTPQPQPGTLVVSVATTAQDVGAVQFVLSGTGITNVRPAKAGIQVYSTPGSQGWQVAAVGTKLSGALVDFDVPDVARPEEYTLRLVESVDDSNDPIRTSTGLALSVSAVR